MYLRALFHVLALSPALASQDAKLPASSATKLRTLLAEALEKPGKKSLSALESEGKRLEKKYRFEDLLAALARGPRRKSGLPKPRKLGRRKKEKFERFGSALTGLGFEVDGHRYQYAVDLPPGFKNKKAVPLLVDPGHGGGARLDQKGKAGYLDYFRRMARAAGGKDWLVVRTEIIEQIGTGGVHKELPEDEVCLVFDAFFRDIASRFHVDLDRIYVAGLSQTGFWSWYLGRARADRLAGIVPMGSVTWQVDRYLENFRNLPVHVLHGDQDPKCPVRQPRATTARMKELGFPVEYQEIQGGKHDYSVWQHLGPALQSLARAPRARYPKKLSKKLQTEATPWCYWIRADKLKRKGPGKATAPPTASLAAEIQGQTIDIETEGIAALTLCLSSKMLDLDEPVVVRRNGRVVHKKRVRRDFARTLRVAVDKCDWLATYEAFVRVK
ncbi:MAG: hypothetical protein ACE5F1_22810 [Planctomycetota bacterium]